jgi:RimJ/RimL family protein N-acetyltransferase
MNARPLLLLPRALPCMPTPGAWSSSHVFQATPSRPFADLPVPPQPTVYAARKSVGMDAHTAAFLSALERSRALEGRFAATLRDVNAANEVLCVESRSNERLQRSTTYEGLRTDAIALARMPTTDSQRQPRLELLFQRQVALMASHAPGLLMPRHFWSTAACGVLQAPPARPASDVLASFQLASGQSLSLVAVAWEDPQALSEFFQGLSMASFGARFPRPACGRDQLATEIVLHAQHPILDRRQVTLVLRDEAQDIVGLLDYHQRSESMMRYAAETARAAGQPLPRLGLKSCELNVVIADALQGEGLGPRLLAFGMAQAIRDGYQQLVAVVATANLPMQRCLAQMGASVGTPLPDSGYELYVLNPQALRA